MNWIVFYFERIICQKCNLLVTVRDATDVSDILNSQHHLLRQLRHDVTGDLIVTNKHQKGQNVVNSVIYSFMLENKFRICSFSDKNKINGMTELFGWVFHVAPKKNDCPSLV